MATSKGDSEDQRRRKRKKKAAEEEIKQGMSISVKLIAVSGVLLTTVIFLFAIMNNFQTRKRIDDSSKRLANTITEGLRQAGTAQLRLLAETTLIAMQQHDVSTLQTILVNMYERDERLTEAAVVDMKDNVLAHTIPGRIGSKAHGFLKQEFPAIAMWVKSGVFAGGQRSITFAYPVEDEDGKRLCNVFLAFSLRPLEAGLAKAEERKNKVLSTSLNRTILVGVIIVLLGMVLTIIQAIRISRPIQDLASKADDIAKGVLTARVIVKSNDEIGMLGHRFNYMAEQIRLLMEETKEKVSMAKELELASAVQTALVPDSAVVKERGIYLAGYFHPAAQCGGDWWSYFNLSDGRLLVIIGDVTGHGVGAAMVTAAAKGAASTVVATSRGELDVNQLLQAMNTAIYDTSQGLYLMTCFVSLFDPKDHTLSFANAAHNFPYHYNAKEQILDVVVNRGNRLGEKYQVDFETKTISVNTDDMLVWYTDGVVECENARGKEFGGKRFRNVIQDVVHLQPDKARDSIMDRAVEFYGKIPQKDDITLVVAKFG